jgi:RNA polymerase sigma-70 factor, ECF subfamily
VVKACPEQPEPKGLLAMMLFIDSRSQARHASDGRFVPLDQQDCEQWDAGKIDEANALLWEAQKKRTIGCYQLEAAIQSVQSDRMRTGYIDWLAIYELYTALVQIQPGIGAQVAKCVVRAKVDSSRHALDDLQKLPMELIARYQPYWVAMFHLAKQVGEHLMAENAVAQAIELTTDASIIEYLSSLK